MLRHFVPARLLHPLAPLMRLSLVDLPSANSMKCCSPPASLEKQIPKIRPFGHKKIPLKQFGYLPCLFQGDHITFGACVFFVAAYGEKVLRNGSDHWKSSRCFFRRAMPSAPLGTAEPTAEPNRIRISPVPAIFSSRSRGSADGAEVRSRGRRRIHRRPS